jgi:hypothetical protein
MITYLLSRPLLGPVIWLGTAAVLLPIIVGIAARLVAFERDADDIERLPKSARAEALRVRSRNRDPSEFQAEPNPVYWQPRQGSAGAAAVIADAPLEQIDAAGAPGALEEDVPPGRPDFEYSGNVPNRAAVKSATERFWKKWAADPTNRANWALNEALLSGPSPFSFAGAAGSDGEGATLTVTIVGAAAPADREALRQIWEQVFVMNLSQEVGYDVFSKPRRIDK